jgi:glycerol-3-phosphate dehydrogenase
MSSFDLIVIGGGINGAGIARDAAMRGLRVCLIEQADLCNATTRWSSRLIHGGLRYLEYAELGLVRESLSERDTLLRLAPHLVKLLPMLIPIYRGARRGRALIKAGLWLYDLLSAGKLMPRHQMLNVAEARARLPQLNDQGLLGAAAYTDAQLVFPERLVVENALAARRAGATIRTWTRVERILVENGEVTGVAVVASNSGRSETIAAPLVVNAAGPWVDRLMATVPGAPRRLLGGSRGSHIVVDALSGITDTACYAEAGTDGRPFFIMPWNGLTLIGTTDIPFEGDPGAAHASDAEIDYLLAETQRLFPSTKLTRRAIHYTYAGVRALPYVTGREQAAITRRHHIRHHRDVAHGLYSVIGGKLTTYRHLAEQVVDRLARKGRHDLPRCATARRPLPGAAANPAEVRETLFSATALRPAVLDRLIGLYGSRAADVAELAKRHPELAAEICPARHAIAAEVVFAFDAEFAATLADVLMRRTMLGLERDLGRSVFPAALEAARRHFGWGPARVAEEQEGYLQEVAALRLREADRATPARVTAGTR